MRRMCVCARNITFVLIIKPNFKGCKIQLNQKSSLHILKTGCSSAANILCFIYFNFLSLFWYIHIYGFSIVPNRCVMLRCILQNSFYFFFYYSFFKLHISRFFLDSNSIFFIVKFYCQKNMSIRVQRRDARTPSSSSSSSYCVVIVRNLYCIIYIGYMYLYMYIRNTFFCYICSAG